jgi:hypothetical protein
MSTIIPFGEWLPDLPDLANPGATVAKNVVPDAGSYRSFPKLTVYSDSIGGVCKGAIVARDNTGNYFNYVADTSAIYVSNARSFSAVTRVSGSYNTPSEDFWEFVQFGNRVFAVNGANADLPQHISLGAANFADLSSAPRAKHIATIKDFVVLGNISSTAGVAPQMVRWCAINNPDSWTPDAATQADFQDLPGDGGWIQSIVGGEYGSGLVFQERAVYRMTYVGGQLVFQFDKVQTNVGVYAPGSVASYRNVVFFLSEEGFYMYDGTNIVPIGSGKVDQTFFADLDVANVHRMRAIVDAQRKIVIWAYPGSGNAGGNPNRLMIYNWHYKKWSRVEDINVENILRAITDTFTLDGLDAISTNLDTLVVSLDDAQWRTGNMLLGAFNADHRLALFNGSAMGAEVETGEQHFNARGLTYVTEVRPVVIGESASVTLAVATRNVLTENPSYGVAQSPNSTGFVSVRATGRFHRFKMTTADGSNFEHLMGVDVLGQDDGVR